MKKGGTIALVVVTVAFFAFTLGLLLGRSFGTGQVSIDPALTQSRATEITSAATTQPAKPDKVNINTADAELLQTLPGVGEALAQRIINHRQTYGPFLSISELAEIKGIGEQTLQSIAALITVED